MDLIFAAVTKVQTDLSFCQEVDVDLSRFRADKSGKLVVRFLIASRSSRIVATRKDRYKPVRNLSALFLRPSKLIPF